MNQSEHETFTEGVAVKLKTYVYRLIDPRNGETFYVGKGKGDRVFAHIRTELTLEGDELDNKLKRIRDIRLAGFDVAHVIHRHGMDDKTAFEVEAALMDAYPGLTMLPAVPDRATTARCTLWRSFADTPPNQQYSSTRLC